MKSLHFAKTLGLVALSSLALSGGVSHAYDRGHQGNPYLPNVTPPHAQVQFGHDRHRAPDWQKQRELYRDIEARQRQQMARIQTGVRHGAISGREERRLMREQREIERMQRGYSRDGMLTLREWRELDRMLDNAQRNIVAAINQHNRRWASR